MSLELSKHKMMSKWHLVSLWRENVSFSLHKVLNKEFHMIRILKDFGTTSTLVITMELPLDGVMMAKLGKEFNLKRVKLISTI
jgi:hypothetical protein